MQKVSEVKLSYANKVLAKDRKKVTGSVSCEEILRPFFVEYMEHREAMFALLMNRGNQVLGVIRLSEGGTSGTVVDLKILFQSAILANASSIIISHNHPSGQLKPSQADIDITKKIVEAGKLFDIMCLDHLILTTEGSYSFADEGLI